VILTKYVWSPDTQGCGPVVRSMPMSAGLVTSRAWPTAVTDQPERVTGSNLSASKATTAPWIAARSLPLGAVRITMSPASTVKFTSSTAGIACRV